MRIRVFSGIATASTPLAAFDRALQAGGVHDANLIVLSSVVPAGASVERAVVSPDEIRVGDRLYCVMAEERTSEPGTEAWAGLGWAVSETGDGGVFAEAHGRSEHQVRWDLANTLETLVADRPYLSGARTDMEVVGTASAAEPVCALVLAVYEVAPWRECADSQ